MPEVWRVPLPFGFALALAAATNALAWDAAGHAIVNQIALDSLPADYPAWVKTPPYHEGRIVFLSDEPDRWRNSHNHTFSQYNRPDHQIDLEWLPAAGIDLATLTPFRDDFIVQFAAGRAAHPERFPVEDPARDPDHIYFWPGFLPWAITSWYGMMVSDLSYLSAYEKFGGTHDEINNARADVIYVMGVMGHFVGDASQPLHTTTQFNGWNGPDPQGYTTSRHFHAWIDGGFIDRVGINAAGLRPKVRPARVLSTARRPDGRDPIFVQVVDFIVAQNQLVEPLYRLERDGALKMNSPGTPEGRAFIEGQLLKSGQLLGDLWVTALTQITVDTHRRDDLLKQPHRQPAAPAP